MMMGGMVPGMMHMPQENSRVGSRVWGLGFRDMLPAFPQLSSAVGTFVTCMFILQEALLSIPMLLRIRAWLTRNLYKSLQRLRCL